MSHAKISEIFEDIINSDDHEDATDTITVANILSYLQERGFGVLIILLSLPSAIPGCPPPIPSIFALPLSLIAAQMIIGRHTPSLPNFITRKSLQRVKLQAMLKKSRGYLQKIDHIVKPRITAITSPRAEKVLGTIILLFSLSVMIPLPMTNTVPSIGIILIGIGIISRDAIPTIAGIAIGFTWIAALIILSNEIFSYISS